jgi:hypothetical protein
MSGSVFASNYQPQIWQPPAPLPTLPSHKPNIGAGASAMVYSFALSEQQQIQFLWQPPDPQPVQPNNFDANPVGAAPHTPPLAFPALGNAPGGVTKFGAIPTYTTYPTPSGGLTPQAGVASVVAVGGQSVVAIVGPVNGGQIFNGSTAQ